MHSARFCAEIAVITALLIGSQYVLSAVPGVEVVTLLISAYSFTMGAKKGMLSSTCFSLLRQFIFGFSPTVLTLYLLYFNMLALIFSTLGKKPCGNKPAVTVSVATLCTAIFTMLDNVITPLWMGWSANATAIYFRASLPFMLVQCLSTLLTMLVLFRPLSGIFKKIKAE